MCINYPAGVLGCTKYTELSRADFCLGPAAVPYIVTESFVKTLGFVPHAPGCAALLTLSSGLRALLVFLPMQWTQLSWQHPAALVPK